MYQHDLRLAHQHSDRGNVADKVEIELLEKRSVDGVRWADLEQRIAIRWRLDDRFCADVAACTRTIVDNESLAQALREPLTHQTCKNVVGAAGREWDDDAHRPRRIGLRLCDLRDSRERGNARRQVQETATRKRHDGSPGRRNAVLY